MRNLVIGRDRITRRVLAVPPPLRFRHAYLLGRTGAGKSSLLRRFIQQDAKDSAAVIVFDAGDLVRAVYEALPEETLERVWYFTADHPIPYNPLLRRRDEPARLENELFALVDQVTAEASSTAPLTARMRRLLSYALRECLKEPTPTLVSLAEYLIGRKTQIRSAMGLREDEFATTHEGVVDRLSQFLRDPRIRRIIAGGHELDFGKLIDDGAILLVSLAGLEKPFVRFLGTLFFHGLQATILERPEEKRRPVSIYVDEFQDYIASTYAVSNFQTLFAQGRRYLTSLTIAHQDFGTIDTRLLSTIHGNAGTAVAFSCGVAEARTMSELFARLFPSTTLAMLPDYEAVVRIGQRAPKTPVVAWVVTYPPPSRVREMLPEPAASFEDVPPDPFDLRPSAKASEAPQRDHGKRDPYTAARKPRRKAS